MILRKAVRAFVIALALLLVAGFYYCWIAFPIATGYGAKVMCSAVFVSERDERDILAEDLNFAPVSFANYRVDRNDSSVTCSMFGFAVRKAIYRQGLGATIVNERSEREIRSQRFRLPVQPQVNTDTIPWPMGDKQADSFPVQVDRARLLSAVDAVFERKEEEYTNLTRALIVLYDGRIVAERYAPGFTRRTRFAGWSMTKSITGALAGILVKQKTLSIYQPALVDEWIKGEDKRRLVTVKHLLQQTSGLDFKEVYNKPADANRMLFVKGDAAKYAADRRLMNTPGAAFNYSSGNSNILSGIYRRLIGDSLYHSFPYKQLFYKVGMYSTLLECDASGTFVGSSFCYATARDWARFGALYLNNGMFNGEQVLPPDWVQLSTTPATAAEAGEYGFQWWLNAGAPQDSLSRLYPELPADMYFADGYEGQNIFVIPSKKLVVVRLGLSRNKHWGEHEFLQAVVEAVKSARGEPVPICP